MIAWQSDAAWLYAWTGFVIPAGAGPQSVCEPFAHGPSRTFQP